MKKDSVILFDVDGVLLDSLAPHLQICEDQNIEYQLGLSIPSVSEFRQLIRDGVTISPMKHFYKAVGFNDKDGERALHNYQKKFSQLYSPKMFPGINEMLSKLSSHDFTMGILTSNVLSNVINSLGNNMEFFRPELTLAKDNPEFQSKSSALKLLAARARVDIKDVLYVGDQPADYLAAKESGAKFLGVTFGWGISQKDFEFPIANSVQDITDFILGKELGDRVG